MTDAFARVGAPLLLCLWLLAVAITAAAGTAVAATDMPPGVVRAPAPAWVIPADPDANPPVAAIGGRRHLLIDEQASLLGDEPVRYTRRVSDVAHRSGLESAGRYSILFQPDYQQVQLHALRVTRDGTTSDRIDEARYELLRQERDIDAGVLDGSRRLILLLPDIRVGDRIDVSYSVVGTNPVFGGEFHHAFSLRHPLPVATRLVSVVAPESRRLYFRVVGAEETPTERVAGGQRRLSLAISQPLAVKLEAGTPASYDPYGALQVSTLPDWRAVVARETTLFALSPASRERVAALAQELGLGGRPDSTVALDALRFVQREIRYVSLSLGENSHRPAAPETTLARRFGDCKDKALFFVALVRAAGLEAEPVLVNTQLGSVLDRWLPSPNSFDHVIARVRLDGDWQYVDPTRDTEVGGFASREPIRFEYGLPVAAGIDGLVEIPVTERPEPEVEEHAEIRLEAASRRGEAKPRQLLMDLSTTYRRREADAVRSWFEYDSAERMGNNYVEFLQKQYRGLTQVEDPQMRDDAARNELLVEEHYRMPVAANPNDPDTLGMIVVRLYQFTDIVPRADEQQRDAPLALTGKRHVVQQVAVRYERGWFLTDTDEHVENDWFEFSRSVRVKGEVLTVRAEWRRKAEAIPAADYPAARDDLRRVRDLLGPLLYLHGAAAPRALTTTDALWPLAAWTLSAAILGGLWHQRRRHPVAGIFFAPKATAPTLSRHGLLPVVLLGGLIVAALVAAMTATALMAVAPVDWMQTLKRSLRLVLKMGLAIAVTAMLLRMFQRHAGVVRTSLAGIWAAWPFVLLTPLAWLAIVPAGAAVEYRDLLPRGPVWIIMVSTMSSLLLFLIAIGWTLIAATRGMAGAAAMRSRVVSIAVFASLISVVWLFRAAAAS